MKKILLILIGLALLAFAPYFVGSKAETHFYKVVDLIKQHPSVSLTITEYNRGWLSSSATVEIDLLKTPGTEFDGISKITVVETMHHGPVLWRTSGLGLGLIDSSAVFVLPAEWQSELDKLESINDKTLLITSRVAFDFSMTNYVTLAAIKISEDGVNINIRPAFATFFMSMEGEITGSMDWQGLEISDDSQTFFKMQSVHVESSQQLVHGTLFAADAIFTGSAEATIDSFLITPEAPGQVMGFNKSKMKASSDIEQDLMSVNVAFTVEKVKAIAQEFSDFEYDFSLLNLDVKAMQKFGQLVVDAQSLELQDSEALATAVFKNMLSIVPELLDKNPIFKLHNLGITTSEGVIASQVEISVDAEAYDPDNMMSLLKAMKLVGSAEGPEAFFANLGFAATIEPLIQQNMLIRDQQQLKLEFEYINGQAVVNGNAIPIPGM